MASIGYSGAVVFSPDQLREHFRDSNELTIEGAASFTISDLRSATVRAYLHLSSKVLKEDSAEGYQIMSQAIKKVIDCILQPLGKVLKGVESDGDLNIQAIEEEKRRLRLLRSTNTLKLVVAESSR